VTAQFIPNYFGVRDVELSDPKSLIAEQVRSTENPYLMEARSGNLHTIQFPHFLDPYRPLIAIGNVSLFAKQAKAFQLFIRNVSSQPAASDAQASIALGQCLAVIAYAQLIAENAVRLQVPHQIVSAIFHLLVLDLNAASLTLASSAQSSGARLLARRLVSVPLTSSADWDFVAEHLGASPIGRRDEA